MYLCIWEYECVDDLRNVLGGIESEKTGFELKCRFK